MSNVLDTLLHANSMPLFFSTTTLQGFEPKRPPIRAAQPGVGCKPCAIAAHLTRPKPPLPRVRPHSK